MARALKLAYSALAVTDECSLAGVVRAHEEAKKQGLALLIGAHFRLESQEHLPAMTLIALAQNREGYGNLSELITMARTRTTQGHLPVDAARLQRPAARIRASARPARLPRDTGARLPGRARRARSASGMAGATFPARAWLGLTLLTRAMDDLHHRTINADSPKV